MTEHITIHGDEWKRADIQEEVEWAREQQWRKQKWIARDALVSKGDGTSSEYLDEEYNPKYNELVKGGWEHDHCEICWWTLQESDEPERGEGYTTNGQCWICNECFDQFIASKK